ncbi:MAG: hypothetical protein V4465_03315 [Patescibacteria group bacterium]
MSSDITHLPEDYMKKNPGAKIQKRFFVIDCCFSSERSGSRPMELSIGNYPTPQEAHKAGKRVRTKKLTKRELADFRRGVLAWPGGYAVESRLVYLDKRIRNGGRINGEIIRFGWRYPLFISN